jgi:hypothetical protein
MIFKKNCSRLKTILFPVVLRLHGIIIPPPIMAQSKKNFLTKPSYSSISSKETVQKSKSKPKISYSCLPLSNLYRNLKSENS